jgi:hypothetical protein
VEKWEEVGFTPAPAQTLVFKTAELDASLKIAVAARFVLTSSIPLSNFWRGEGRQTRGRGCIFIPLWWRDSRMGNSSENRFRERQGEFARKK